MASIADLEQLLEQVFERSTSRLFRTKMQPVQLEHRIERAMERSRAGRGSRTEVPSRYRLRINPLDLEGLAPDPDAAQALAARLADAALAFARAHAYHLARRPSVALVVDPSLERGRLEVDVDARGVPDGRSASAPPAEAEGGDDAVNVDKRRSVPGPAPSGEHGVPEALPGSGLSAVAATLPDRLVGDVEVGDGAGRGASTEDATPREAVVGDAAARDAGARVVPGSAPSEDPAPGLRATGAQTQGFRRPSPESARAVLRMLGADGRERSIEVDGRPMTVGRAQDNGLVIEDARVSRHHGRLLARHGTLVYADLDSTNGSRVNGVRVDEIALGVGDRILVGDTVLVVESLPG